MEALTHAEALVFEALLGGDGLESDRSRRTRTGLPKSTYQEAKGRLYGEGWLEDRFIPSPLAVGADTIEFRVSQPVAERRQTFALALEQDPTTVLLWEGVQSLFSVRFLNRRRSKQGNLEERDEEDFSLRAEPEQVRVYFDFEGCWSALPGLLPPSVYPRTLPGALPRSGGTQMSPAHLSALRELVSRPFTDRKGSGTPPQSGPHFLPRSQRHLLSESVAAWRVLPKLGRPITVGSATVRQLVLVTGARQPDSSFDGLLPALAADCGAHPFLVAEDEEQVILGLLSLGPLPGQEVRSSSPRPSVLGTVKRFARQVRIIREDLATLRVPVDHRYDRFFTS
ncbi:MAG: hypothetical protein KGJ23_11255 [Euryarchaeota archaeon]|nr:hypothetical protein [Euryarchaeota archaeon]MDE1837171.1 hypothetical protein [Euryarchaeota archaeon]MDE1881095.1 hypothetical protein [Euryarchaeota archaeon]MDE2045327.1 hypothetical protein [Thermoplasmata archaeon]